MRNAPLNILLVEDNPGDALLLREILAEAGPKLFHLVHVTSLSSALQHLQAESVDVFLLDLSLPDAHGLETVTRARAAAPDIPIVVLTGLNDEGFAVHAVREGAQDYLVKGQIDRHVLVRAMRYAIERHRMAHEQKRAEAEIQKLAAFVRFNPNPIFEFRSDGTLDYFNDAAQTMAASLAKRHPAEFLPSQTKEIVKQCLASGKSKRQLETAINRRVISWSFFPVSASQVVHCYAADVTERQNLEAQLRQSQKMESVGKVAGGIAHDFNNILTIIHGHAALLLEAGQLGTEMTRSVERISLAAERAANLTRQLLLFSRKQLMQPRNLDLRTVVNSMIKLLQPILGEDIDLEVNQALVLPVIYADQSMMEQVIMNLAVNSRDAMPKGGKLTIETFTESVDEEDAQQTFGAFAGPVVCLTVTDTGTGIPQEHLPHVFEPFFTTKDLGKGTGLGLATVYGIVKQHQGWLKVSTEVNKGTTFHVFLPAIGEGAEGYEVESLRIQVSGGKETVLVVEDEPPLRELIRNILEGYGYKVLEAGCGTAALELWREHKPEIDLVLTDMIMPGGMTGRELATTLRSEKPELKVIFTTGYSEDVLGKDFVAREGLNFLQKPYHPERIAHAIRECLDGQ
jgi:two-component system, cell cycle sensor histidine kinase and response regulator CckA